MTVAPALPVIAAIVAPAGAVGTTAEARTGLVTTGSARPVPAGAAIGTPAIEAGSVVRSAIKLWPAIVVPPIEAGPVVRAGSAIEARPTVRSPIPARTPVGTAAASKSLVAARTVRTTAVTVLPIEAAATEAGLAAGCARWRATMVVPSASIATPTPVAAPTPIAAMTASVTMLVAAILLRRLGVNKGGDAG
jgi:hypothetical protein